MQGAIEATCSVLDGTNKVGKLKKNDKGYYDLIVGALNMVNSKGQYYDLQSGKRFFEEASDLCRMAEKGMLRGEYGHPNQLPNQSDDDFTERMLRIDEQSACCHHRRIWLDFDRFKDRAGKAFVGIMSTVGPSGPFGPALEKQLENPEENVAFSIRCFTMPHRVGGKVFKEMRHVVTFDYVNEPGIEYATKYDNPTLEHRSEKIITAGSVMRASRNILNRPGTTESQAVPVRALLSAMGLEVCDTPQARRNFTELLRTDKL